MNSAPFLILETGQPVASMRRHRGFPHWIRVAAGLERDQAVTVNVEAGQALPSREGFAGTIVTGSGAMVTDRAEWSERSAAWLREAAHAGMPLLGICYGHQLLAHALGGEVGDHPQGREMGTVALELHDTAGSDPLFAGLPPRFGAQATHLQTVLRAPDGATVLARSVHDACHAFRWGDRAWGVQFHPEFSATHMRGYVRARQDALRNEGRCPKTIVGDIAATPHARRVLRRFVHHARGLHGR
ncbi:glutamine amidotransferase [Lysobacter silvisoli]|uniref:Glutamine amidotransferase n=1 Tax=Lysobacter silvisoli TaxID=2293254 RepID=A0A371JXU9_9GAMM|nr:glutamine amidotransferase [Lysobacter silvisoli]RDZ26464.1 glutamine amidotransferase [Lysobacter silvisoli]